MFSIEELKSLARERGLIGYYNLRIDELINLLTSTPIAQPVPQPRTVPRKRPCNQERDQRHNQERNQEQVCNHQFNDTVYDLWPECNYQFKDIECDESLSEEAKMLFQELEP